MRQRPSRHAGRSASGQRAPCPQRTLRGRPTHPYRPRKPPFRPSAARLPPWLSPARWPRNCRQRSAWAQAQQVAGQQASQEKTGIHKRVSLRNMPKGRARGTLDKVEAVSRNMGDPQGQPEPEDEDLDWLEQQGQQGHEAAQEQSPAARKYQVIALWLLAHGQMAALRELAHGHRVLLLAPAADAPLTLAGHVLVPERAAVAVEDGASQMQMGAQGQALELPARWTQALPADRQWRQWKLRQQSDESGWSLQAPRPERGTPRLLAADNAADPAALANTPASAAESAPERAELITLPEPRRLLDGQWAALAGQAAACLAQGGMLHDLLRLKKQRRKRRSGWTQLKKRNTCRALRACPGAVEEKKRAQTRTNCNIVFLRGLAYWRAAKTVI